MNKEIEKLFKARGYDFNHIKEVSSGVYRVESIYTHGDFQMLPDGKILNSTAGFIGDEEKVEYQKIIDPKQNFKVISEERI